MSSVAVIDYGMGNLHSVAKAVARVAPAANVRVTANHGEILSADRVIFPGVGAIRDCMSALQELELVPVIREVAASRPLLAICVGMQALMHHSTENGGVQCLNLIPGSVQRFAEDTDGAGPERRKVPHMGWNRVQQSVPHPLWSGIEDGGRFYFVHSYNVQPDDTACQAGSCEYGVVFAAALARENVFATQFHPEKSQHNGLRLLENFMNWDGSSI